jgi:hypothetical protein
MAMNELSFDPGAETQTAPLLPELREPPALHMGRLKPDQMRAVMRGKIRYHIGELSALLLQSGWSKQDVDNIELAIESLRQSDRP